MASTLWIVVPVFRDVESFLLLRKKIEEEFSSKSWGEIKKLNFVVVDDTAGVDDETQKIRTLHNVHVITPPFNLGHQRAIVFGLRGITEFNDRDFILTMDADGEDKPEDIPRLLDPLLARSDDLYLTSIAWRTRRRESLAFKLGYTIYKLAFRILTGTIIRTGNFAAFRGFLAKRILNHPHFDLCYSSTLISLNLKTVYVGSGRGTRYAGESRMNFTRLVMHGIRMLMPMLDRIAIRSLIAFSAALVASVLSGLVILGIKLFTELGIPGWATYSLLLVLVLSFVALGNFVILFTIFSQSGSISLSGIDRKARFNDTAKSA